MPLVSRTRATLRSAEFGFFGVVVYTRVHTPRRCGEPFSAGVLVLLILSCRPLRTSCWIVGMRPAISSFVCGTSWKDPPAGWLHLQPRQAHCPATCLLCCCCHPVHGVGRVAPHPRAVRGEFPARLPDGPGASATRFDQQAACCTQVSTRRLRAQR